jgi:TonB-dependent starch-binding outer membrane protein SusC
MSFKNCFKTVACSMLLFLSIHAFAQDKVVSGRVTNAADGMPVSGVSVTVKGTSTGTTTGPDGSYSLNVPAGRNILVFSSVGFAAQEVSIEGRSSADVTLVISTSSMNEVVVIGYGTARRKDLTGSIATVSSKDFVKGPITSPAQLIAGKVAGVSITSNSGEPGVGARIRIRGGASLNSSNDPLIVIDGVPLDNIGIQGAPNALSLINPNDIETFTILKDASAAAIYGNRASNGVILITTKKGASGGRVKVSFSTLNSISHITDKVDVMSADEFRAYVNAHGSAADIARLGTENTDWQEEIYRSAFSTDNIVALSGGVKRLPYRLSLGFLNQDGVLKTSNMKRYTVGLNLNPKFLDDKLAINAGIKYVHNTNFYGNTDAIGTAVYFDPSQPIRTTATKHGGYWEWIDPNNNGLNGLAGKNPVGLINQQENISDVDRFIGNIQFDYKLHWLPDLRLNLNLGLDNSNGGGSRFVPADAAVDSVRGGRYNQYSEKKTNKLMDFYLNYVKEVKSISSRFDIMAGHSYQDWERKSPSYADLKADRVTEYAKAGQPFQAQNTLLSFYGRLNYALMNKYLFTVSMRRDGSSKFSKDNRWGNFPSAAAAWNVSDENFMKGQRFFSNFKFRLGWGKTGQQDGIYEYGYQPNYFYGDSAAQYQFGNQYYVVVRPNAFDANLKWEETVTKNVGIEMGFLKNRLNIGVEFYEKETEDLLANVQIPAGTNFSDKVVTNVGSINNKGLEVTLNSALIQKGDFTLDAGYNLTWIIKSEITKLQLVNDPTYLGTLVGGGGGFNNVQILSVGYRPYMFFLFRQVYDKDGKPIEGLYEDRDGNGVINEYDKDWVRNPEPKTYMGFTTNATYKNLSAGFVMRASLGNYMYNGTKANSAYEDNVITGQRYLNNAHRNILETDFTSIRTFSDYYLENASFLKMDNFYIGYDFGTPFNNKNIRLRTTLNCQNVFTVTKYSGLDPEINGGIDNTIYPRPRMFALGINLDF